MKIELKNYRPAHQLSRETTAFTASIWIDGKRAGTVSNDGHGGCNLYHFDDRTLEQEFHDYCKSLPPVDGSFGPLDMDADLLIGELCEAADHERWLKSKTRNAVLFRLEGDNENEYRTVKLSAVKGAPSNGVARERIHAAMKQKYSGQIVEIH